MRGDQGRRRLDRGKGGAGPEVGACRAHVAWNAQGNLACDGACGVPVLPSCPARPPHRLSATPNSAPHHNTSATIPRITAARPPHQTNISGYTSEPPKNQGIRILFFLVSKSKRDSSQWRHSLPKRTASATNDSVLHSSLQKLSSRCTFFLLFVNGFWQSKHK